MAKRTLSEATEAELIVELLARMIARRPFLPIMVFEDDVILTIEDKRK